MILEVHCEGRELAVEVTEKLLSFLHCKRFLVTMLSQRLAVFLNQIATTTTTLVLRTFTERDLWFVLKSSLENTLQKLL